MTKSNATKTTASKAVDKPEQAIVLQDLVWTLNGKLIFETYEARTALGLFVLKRRFVQNNFFLTTPMICGRVEEIECTDLADGKEKARLFILSVVTNLVAVG